MILVVPRAREVARGDAEDAETMRGASAAEGTTHPLPGAASGPRSILVYGVRRELAATLWDAAGPPPAEDARPCRARGRRA